MRRGRGVKEIEERKDCVREIESTCERDTEGRRDERAIKKRVGCEGD